MGESIDITYETRSSLVSEQGFNYTQAMQAVNSASVDFAVRADISVDTYGIYGVYRTAGPLYAKIKAGVLSVETSADLSVTEATVTVVDASNMTSTFPFEKAQLSAVEEAADLSTISETETEFSIGVGAGYKFSDKFAVELEFTRLSSDFDSYSLSAKYHF